MPIRPRLLLGVALTCGVVIGASITVAALTTSSECVRGDPEGDSGVIATVVWLIVAPPGGLVSYSESEQQSTHVSGSGAPSIAGYGGSTNQSIAVLTVINWTSYHVASSSVSGFGAARGCPAYALVPNLLTNATTGGCFGCVVAPPVPATIGARVVLPTSTSYAGYPTSDFDGNYSAAPIGNFSWGESGGEFYGGVGSPGLAAAGVTISEEAEANSSQDYLALTYSIPPGAIGIGVPIHLTSGGSVIEATPVSTLSPGWTLWHNVTYEFPAATDQGTWWVYEAAPGSPDSIGGLLFTLAQTATAP